MNNDKCSWKLETHWFIGYSTECGEATDGEPLDWIGDKEAIIGSDYTYCPYCGRIIDRIVP